MATIKLTDLEIQIIQAMRAAKTTQFAMVAGPIAAPVKTWASKKDRALNLGFPCTVKGDLCAEDNLRSVTSGGAHLEDVSIIGTTPAGKPIYDQKWHYRK